MEEFLIQFFADGRRTAETHPFVCNGEVITDSEAVPILLDNRPIISQGWCLGDRPPERWKMNEQYFGYLPDDRIQHLFIGTFPPQSVTFNYGQNVPFFYGSIDNLMWQIMPHLSNHPVVGRDYFTHYRIGVTDVVRRINRVEFGGADSSVVPIEYNNIHLILEEYESICDVYFTSSGLINSALGWTWQVLNANIPGFPSAKVIKDLGCIPANFFGRHIRLHFLYTPSDLGNQQIYNNRKSLFYTNLFVQYGLLDIGERSNKALAESIAAHLDLPHRRCVFRLFQWANCLRGVEGLVRRDLLDMLDDLGAVNPIF